MLFIKHTSVNITDIVIKYFILFLLLNANDTKEISINNPKSINNGGKLNTFFTVTPLNIMPFIKLVMIKETTNK